MYEIQNLYLENISINQLELLLCDKRILYYSFILHDKDKNSNGELKKAHYHLIIDFNDNSHHKLDKVKDFFKNYSCRIKAVTNLKKFHRYLTHKDNKEKYQYSDSYIYSSDYELYNELITLDIKMSNTDNFLKDFFDICVSEYFNNDFIFDNDYIRDYFICYGKIDYYMKYRDKISLLAREFLTSYIIFYEKITFFSFWLLYYNLFVI